MNNKKLQVWLPLLFAITMIAGIFIGFKLRDEIPGKPFFYREKQLPIQEIMNLIANKYVDTVNLEALSDTAVNAMLAKLDPHSIYIPASELDAVNEDIAGSFYGIGIEFTILNDTLHVVNVLKDGPGAKAGLKIGDRLLKADGHPITGKKINIDSIRVLLRGERGTKVEIELLRGAELKKIPVTRDMIPVSSVDASYMIDSTSGYIRLNKFSQQTYREFMISLEALKKQGLRKLILDLRGNGGGVLEEAIEIADEFLSDDKLITYTIGQHYPRKEYRCRRVGQFETGQLVVLADESTASASEVLIGALQDWDRASIIGRRTFGKGLVQDQFDLSDKSALRLTIARYYTPVGRNIQRPYNNGGKAYYEEIEHRFTDGESFSADSIKFDSSKMYRTAAGKKIFGGGGIAPDYFIPADTGKLGTALHRIYTKGLMADFGYKYYIANPAISTQYKNAADFSMHFTPNENAWHFMESLAVADSVDLSGITENERTYLKSLLKASIARQLWRNEGYYEVMNKEDKAVLKAMEVLEK